MGDSKELSAAQRALLQKLRQGAKASPAEAGDELSRQGRSRAPVSLAQRRLWFLEQLIPDTPLYNLPVALRIRGHLDRQALQSAMTALIARHEILRTGFIEESGEGLQIISADCSCSVSHTDLKTLAKDSQPQALAERISKLSLEPFDLSRPPLLRAELVELSADESVLVLVMHHIVSDGWSLPVLFDDLWAEYLAATGVQPAPLPLAIQYADYSQWQRGWLTGARLERQLSYWRDQLSGAPRLDFPADRPRPIGPSHRGSSESLRLDESVQQGLASVGKQSGCTLYMIALAAFAVLLQRYARQDDIVVGTPIANRPRPELEPLVGFFVNSLVMRVDLSGDPDFSTLLKRVKSMAIAAYDNQDLPFDKLVEDLDPERSLDANPYFGVLFAVQSALSGQVRTIGERLVVTEESVPIETTRFDFEMHVWERSDGLELECIYSTELFAQTTIARLLNHYKRILQAVVDAPDARLSTFELLTAHEARQLQEWNDCRVAYPAKTTLVEEIAARLEAAPDRVAVLCEGQELTAGELSRQSNRLAHYLRKKGVAADVPVGIFLERSLDMVVAILGILKAGGAYLPLDPDYPRERLAWMLRDAGPPVILTHGDLVAQLPDYQGQVLCLDTPDYTPSTESGRSVESFPDPHDLAYVIFTSGSTGRPKGVMNEHAGISNRIRWMQDAYRLTDTDVVLQKTPYSFDVSVWEFLWPLLTGARLVMAKPGGHRDPAYLAELIASERVTVLHFVPSMLDVFLAESGLEETCASVRHIVCSGEALSGPLQRRCHALLPQAQLHNLYGPTEAAVDVTHWTCVADDRDASVPIGRPVANTEIHLLDAHQRPVAVGVPGELYIGGVQVARGYINRDELTAERFVEDPFAGGAGAKLYRTGDLARRRSDGVIEFLGRLDDQVKIRGLRVELGEVVARLEQHAGVRQAVVVAGSGNRSDVLVGYYVPKKSAAPNAEELTSWLAECLPDYMLPAVLMPLEDLPKLPNGKVDRNKLPAPDWPGLTEFVAPRTEVEQPVAAVFAAVLGVDQVGANDNFFRLGGHSLLAAKVASRLRDDLGRPVPLRLVFDCPTVAQLAEVLSAGASGHETQPIQASGERRAPLSFAQKRLWVLSQLHPDSALYNSGLLLQLTGRLNVQLLKASLAEIVRRHAVLRTTYGEDNGQAYQEVAAEAVFDVPVVDFSHLPEAAGHADVRARVTAEIERPFDLTAGPVFRVALLRLKPEEHLLVMPVHHIAFDGQSITLLLEELAQLYAAQANRETHELDPLTVQYPDFAAWQRQDLSGERLTGLLEFWGAQLDGLPALDLKADREPGADASQAAFTRQLAFAPELAKQVAALGQAHGATPFMTLLAGFKASLFGLTGQRDLVIGSPIANRQRAELEPLIGFFVNMLVLRTKLDAQQGFAHALERVRETALAAYEHQDLPFEKLVQVLEPERHASRNPLFQASFALQVDGAGLRRFAGISAKLWSHPVATSRFDLEVDARPEGEGWCVVATASADRFEPATIERLLAHYRDSLERLVAEPERPLADLFERSARATGSAKGVALESESKSPDRRALLKQMLKAQAGETAVPPLVPAARDEPIPLSFSQQRLWYLDQLRPGTSTYNLSWLLRVRGVFDTQALERAVAKLAERHESLRTVFRGSADSPEQVILPSIGLPVEWERLPKMSDAQAGRHAQQLMRIPFDLKAGPLFRIIVLERSATDSLLMAVMHHIISDGWSIGVLARELDALYREEALGERAELAALPVQYADYAVWQRRWQTGAELEHQLAHWRAALEGAPPLLELPTDRPRPATQTFVGTVMHHDLEPPLRAALADLAQRQGCTLFMVFLAAFKLLMARWSGQSDIVIGTPIAGRQRTEIEGLIGFFVNTLAIRAEVDQAESFADLIQRVKPIALDAYANQDLPFEKIAEELDLKRDPSYSPIVQVLFSVQSEQGEPLQSFGGLEVRREDVDDEDEDDVGGIAKYDLTVSVIDHEEDTWGIVIEYNTDLFDKSTIERLAQHYEQLLLGAVENPNVPCAKMPLLGEQEQAKVKALGEPAAAAYPREATLCAKFAEQVAQRPETVALNWAEGELNYAEVDRQSNQLAHRLIGEGVKPGDRVALVMSRSPQTVVATLAVLKAGAAYLPLDPQYPADRLLLLLEDAKPRVAIVEDEVVASLAASDALLMAAGELAEKLGSFSQTDPGVDIKPTDLAYLMYTSGSTGTPKAVAVTHRNILRLVFSQDYVDFSSRLNLLLLAPPFFDASTFELWGALLHGGRCTVYPERIPSVATLSEYLEHHSIDALFLTTALFNTVVDAAPKALKSLRWLLFGGEAHSMDHVRRAAEALPDTQVVHVYGPTETTTFATAYPVPRALDSRLTSIPIGRPISHTSLYVVNEAGELNPPGITGELLIGGDGVASGYWQREEQTRAAFVPDLYADDGAARLYRTGDQVRWTADGQIEFVGRKDFQVKIRGFRIELGEIETALRQRDGVREVIVLARSDTPGEKRLVAYVVAEESPDELRAGLQASLPDYMVPETFVCLDEMPLTPNGKIDRKALPIPEWQDEAEYVAPRTNLEQQLAEIWAGVLGLDQIGIHDNFFSVGGDSILAIQVTSKANEAGIEISPLDIFRGQTVAELAACAGQQAIVEAEQGLVTGPFQLTPIQQWFFEQSFVTPDHWNMSLALDASEPTDVDVLRQAADSLGLHHDMLRARFHQQGNHWTGLIAEDSGADVFRVVDLSELSVDEQPAAVERSAEDAQSTLSLANGPVFRVVCFRFGDGQPDKWLLIAHHLVVDGVSLRVLLDDLVRLYQGIAADGTVSLPLKTTSFTDWACALGQFAASETVAAEADFWITQQAGGSVRLPLDHPAGDNTEASMGTSHGLLTAAETEQLLRVAPAAYATRINDLLMTALCLTLQEVRQADHMSCVLEGHGREEIDTPTDTTRTVSWFTTMFPLRLAISDPMDLGAAILTTKNQLAEIPQKGLGYGLLRYLGAEEMRKQLAGLPWPDVSFNYLGQFDQTVSAREGFSLASGLLGSIHGAAERRPFAIDVIANVAGGQLQVQWLYSRNLHDAATVDAWAARYVEHVRKLVAHCVTVAAERPASADGQPETAGSRGVPALSRRERGEVAPTSYAQQRFWFLEQLAPGNTAYNVGIALHLSGAVRRDLLEQAFSEMLERHESLRTRFDFQDGDTVQIVAQKIPLPFEFEDAGGKTDTDLTSYLRGLAAEPFDLQQGPLLKLTLLQLGPEEFVLLMRMHHIIYDGWSEGVFFKELSALYAGLVASEPATLEPLPIQYADYAIWQREYLSAAELARQLEYWRTHLAGAPPVVELPVDRPREMAVRYRGQRRGFTCRAGLLDALKRLAATENATLFMVLLAALDLFLARLSGQDDVVVGAPITGRHWPEVADLIGVFLNTLALRTDLGDDPTMSELIGRAKASAINAYAHQDVPFEKVVEEINPERDMSHAPIAQVLLNLHNEPRPGLSLFGVEAQYRPLDLESAVVDLNVHFSTIGGELQGSIQYNTDLFDVSTIDRFARQFELLLEQMIATPQARISTFSLVDPQTQSVLADPSAALERATYPSIFAQFAHRAAEDPDQIAVEQGDRRWTYAELLSSTEALASELLRQEVKSGEVVAILGHKGYGVIVAMLAVWRSGGALLLLDPEQPAERRRVMTEESGARLLIDLGIGAAEEAGWFTQVLHTDADGRGGIEAESVGLPDLVESGPAYVFFTSGSMGVPKGVLGSHQGLGQFAVWQQQEFGIARSDHVALLTNLTFDVILRDICLPLTAGARLCIPEPNDLASLPQWLAERHISVIHAVPTIARGWISDQSHPLHLAQLRYVFFAGEPLTDSLIRGWRRVFGPGSTLVNLYGPTETTLCKLFHRVGDEPDPRVQPLGRPMPGCQALVLSPSGGLCAVGEPGEIALRTPYRSIGYINAEQEQSLKFINNPFTHDPEDVVYLTGDRGRFRADGVLEILGRIDDEVKIRGVRISPADVNAVLAEVGSVNDSAVVAREDRGEEKYLAAYIVPRDAAVSIEAIRANLAERLPPVMVPQAYLLLDALPRLPNGKLDRKALPAPEISSGRAFVAPTSATELTLAEIFCELLNLERVGVDDDFFLLGGHSLLATRLIGRIRETAGIDVPLRRVFESPTIAGLAAYLDDQSASAANADELLDQLESFSDDEVSALLDDLLAEDPDQ